MLRRWFALAFGLLLCSATAARAAELTCSPAGRAQSAQVLSQRLTPVALGLRREVLDLAVKAFVKARCLGQVKRQVLSVIDYSLPSDQPRLWVLDVQEQRLLFHERVAHGRGSGDRWARTFSNRGESHESSLGAFVTGSTYTGKHGLSLLLNGLEPGLNDAARERAIVIHGATYMTASFIDRFGRAGRSWGCPAVDPHIAPALIEAMKDGSFLWAYYPDRQLLRQSRYCSEAAE